MPFNKELFIKYFCLTFLGFLAIGTIAIWGFSYELMPFDIPGSILSSAFIANILQLSMHFKEV